MLDVGSLYVKGGYAGEDTPKALFPSVRAVEPRWCPMWCDRKTPKDLHTWLLLH